ncbi:leucine-rich PPR motif-containing protein, mitochondrial [Aulostomus maculatus]
MIRLLQAMQNYKMYYDRSSLFTSVLSIFSNHEEVLKACEDSQDTLLFVVRTLFSYDLDQLHKLLSYPSFPPMEFTLYYKNFINTFRWCNDMTHIQAVTELICTDRRFSGGKDVMSFILSKLIKNTTEAELMAMTTKLQTYLTWLKELDVKISERCYTKVRQHLLSCHIPELIEAFAPLVSSTEMVSNSTTPPLPDGALAPLVSSTEMVSNSTTPPLPDGALAPLVSSTEMVSNSTTPPLPDGALAPLVSSTAMVFNSKTPPLPDVSVQALENRMQELKEDKKPYNILFERVLRLVMLEGELEHALKLKQQNKEQMTLTSYLSLIALCCKHKEVEKVLELNREMNARYPESVLQPVKYMSLVTFFCRNGKVEEAENILKEMKEKNVTLDNRSTRMLRTMLNVFAIEGNIPLIKRLLEIVLTLGLLSPTRNICAPLIVAHLKSNDLQGALDTAQECLKSFRVLPPLYRLVVRLVEERDTELLQKALEMLTLEHGQMSTLYTLFFAFLDTGHYEEARKIIESNDLEARKVSLQWFAEKCIRAKKMKALEQMVDITRNLSNCDRDDLYCYILRLCKVNNDTEKAKAVWLKMKEENIVLRQRTQLLLAELLRTDSNGVPFEVPETWYQDTAATLEDTATTLEDTATTLEDTTTTALEDTTTTASEDTTTTASEDTTTTASEDTTTTASEDTTTTASEDTTTTASEDTTTTASEDTTTTASEDTTTTLKDLIKLEEDLTNLSENGKSKEAFMMLKEANERDLILSEDTDKKLISAPKGAKAMMDAQRVKGLSMLSQAKNKAYSLLLNDLSKKNKPKDALEMLKYMLEMEIRPVESAVPQLVYALRDQGDIKGIKEVESQIGSLKRPPKIPIMLFHHNLALAHIKNGDVQSAIDILEEIYISGDQKDSSMSFVFKKLFHDGNDGAIDKISAMAERLANQFASYRPAMDLFLQLLATDKVEDARAMLNRVSALDEQQKTMMSYAKKGSRGKELVKQKKNLLIIFPDMFEKATQYNALLECYVKEEDFVQAKAVFEQMWSEGLPIDEGIHKQLVLLYSKAGETFQSDCSLTQTD